MILKGDTFAIARGAPDMNGVGLWRHVYQRGDPCRPAPAMNAMIRAMAPGHVEHHKGMLQMMDEWHLLSEALPRRGVVR